MNSTVSKFRNNNIASLEIKILLFLFIASIVAYADLTSAPYSISSCPVTRNM